jgi:PEP-CTERM motif
MRLHKTSFFIGLLAVCGLTASVAFADTIEYAITVDTSSQFANYGYLELQFNAGSSSTQLAEAEVTNFETDGTLNPADSSNDELNDVTGQLPGTVSFDNGTTFDDYYEGITFGTTITFDLLLSGPAIDSPNGDGGGTFTLDFLNSSQSGYLFTNDPSADVQVLTVNVNPDGSTTAASYASVGDGSPVVTFSGPTVVPEPSMLLLLGGGLVAIGAFRRRRVRGPMRYS